jgi:predicted transcriptional regulator
VLKPVGSLKKRTRLDIYAAILEYVKARPEGAQITRISYSAGLPLDRIKPMLETLASFELLAIRVVGQPLQASILQRRFYGITRKGLEYLDAYRKIQGLITYLDSKPLERIPRKDQDLPPIDYLGSSQP